MYLGFQVKKCRRFAQKLPYNKRKTMNTPLRTSIDSGPDGWNG